MKRGSNTTAAGQLKAYIERIETLEADKAALADRGGEAVNMLVGKIAAWLRGIWLDLRDLDQADFLLRHGSCSIRFINLLFFIVLRILVACHNNAHVQHKYR